MERTTSNKISEKGVKTAGEILTGGENLPGWIGVQILQQIVAKVWWVAGRFFIMLLFF
jgi:hypothetical protein